MADKNLNFNITVNNKQLDLSKTSLKQFNEIIKESKKSLDSMEFNSAEYKQAATDINAAEAAWKAATKAANEFGDGQEKGAEQVKTYRTQIREATTELMRLEQQFGKNSQEYNDQLQKLKELKDAQDDFVESTGKLDDSLAAIPGPIGQIGQAMQQLGYVTNSANSALKSLGLGFSTFDKIVKTSVVGFLVGLLVTLVAAVMEAAKSFKPLQDAFARMGDAVGALFNALKPITDFILNVFVKAIEGVAFVIEKVAGAFGGVSNEVNKTTLKLQRDIAIQERLWSSLADSVSTHTKSIIDSVLEYKKALLAVNEQLKEGTITQKEALDQQFLIELNHMAKMSKLQTDFEKDKKLKTAEVAKMDMNNQTLALNNQRKNQDQQLANENAFFINSSQIQNEASQKRIDLLQQQYNAVKRSNLDDKEQVLLRLKQSIAEETNIRNLDVASQVRTLKKGLIEQQQLRQQFSREDIAAINERSLKIIELTTQLIKEENARNLQAAKDSIGRIKEQYRLEFEQARLAGASIKKLKEQQAAELKLAEEQIRKSQIDFDAYNLQVIINTKTNELVQIAKGSEEELTLRKQIAGKILDQEILLADKNNDLIQQARMKHWQTIFQINQDGLAYLGNQIQVEYDGMYEGTSMAFDKMRELEVNNFEQQQLLYHDNFAMLEAQSVAHAKRMAMIDVAQLQAKADIESRKAATVNQITTEYFAYAREQENLQYQAQIKAAGDNKALVETIEMEHAQRMRDLGAQEFEAKKQEYLAIVQLTAQFGSVLNQIGNQMMQAAQGRNKQQFEAGKKMAIAGVAIEKAAAVLSIISNTAIANAKAVAAFPLTFGQPWVAINTVSAGLSIAATVAGAVQAIGQINSTQFDSGDTAGGAGSGKSGNGMGRGYSQGGLVEGPGTSKSDSIPARLSNGEAVMTSGAVTMFAPMLSMMNQMGGGKPFSINAMTTSADNPITNNPGREQSPIIVKTYVVENEMTNSQERQARLKDLSTL